jgi:hypothetical protein
VTLAVLIQEVGKNATDCDLFSELVDIITSMDVLLDSPLRIKLISLRTLQPKQK